MSMFTSLSITPRTRFLALGCSAAALIGCDDAGLGDTAAEGLPIPGIQVTVDKVNDAAGNWPGEWGGGIRSMCEATATSTCRR